MFPDTGKSSSGLNVKDLALIIIDQC